MNPTSSRTTAATAWLRGLPRADSFLSRACESLLGLPGDGADRGAHPLVPRPQRLGHPRRPPIMPGRLDQDSTPMAVAGFGDPSQAAARAARVLGGNQAHVRHSVRRRGEATEVANRGHQRHGTDHLHPTECLQCLHQRGTIPGCGQLAQPCRQPLDTGCGSFHGLSIIAQDLQARRLIEGLSGNPGQMRLPPVGLACVDPTVTQQELGAVMACDPLGDWASYAPAPSRGGLGGLVRHMDRGQVAAAKIARQLGRIAAIGLDPPPGLNRNQRGGR